MFKNEGTWENRIDIVLKYLLFYSLFIFFIISASSNNFILSLLPSLSLPLIFFMFVFSSKGDTLYPPINLLFLGLIIDTYSFLPLFLSSFTLLLSYKISLLLKGLFVSDDHFVYLLRDATMFMVLFFVLRWFILSYYNENFYPFVDVLVDTIVNIIYSVVIYLISNRLLKNV